MPYKDLCDRYKTFKWVKYQDWTCIEDAESPKQAREMYRNHRSYKWEDFIVIKNNFSSGYSIYIPKNNNYV